MDEFIHISATVINIKACGCKTLSIKVPSGDFPRLILLSESIYNTSLSYLELHQQAITSIRVNCTVR